MARRAPTWLLSRAGAYSRFYHAVRRPWAVSFTGDSAIGANYEQDTLAFTHAPIASSDWRAFEQGWQQVEVPTKALLPLHGKPDFALDSLQKFQQDLLVPDNVMQE